MRITHMVVAFAAIAPSSMALLAAAPSSSMLELTAAIVAGELVLVLAAFHVLEKRMKESAMAAMREPNSPLAGHKIDAYAHEVMREHFRESLKDDLREIVAPIIEALDAREK